MMKIEAFRRSDDKCVINSCRQYCLRVYQIKRQILPQARFKFCYCLPLMFHVINCGWEIGGALHVGMYFDYT